MQIKLPQRNLNYTGQALNAVLRKLAMVWILVDAKNYRSSGLSGGVLVRPIICVLYVSLVYFFPREIAFEKDVVVSSSRELKFSVKSLA